MRLFEKFFGTAREPDWKLACDKIADGFDTVRKSQFESAVKVIQRRLRHELSTLRTSLGGDADCALKGFQLWLATRFLATHPYVPPSESKTFFGLLNVGVSGEDLQHALGYLQEFHEYRRDPIEQCVQVAFPVANYITLTPHPIAATLVGRLMPVFICNTESVIADAFGDRATLDQLQSDMQTIRHHLTDG